MRDIKRKEFLLPAIALAKAGGFPSLTPPRPPRLRVRKAPLNCRIDASEAVGKVSLEYWCLTLKYLESCSLTAVKYLHPS